MSSFQHKGTVYYSPLAGALTVAMGALAMVMIPVIYPIHPIPNKSLGGETTHFIDGFFER